MKREWTTPAPAVVTGLDNAVLTVSIDDDINFWRRFYVNRRRYMFGIL